MDKKNIRFLKENEIKERAKKNMDFAIGISSQNPIKAKFLAFVKTKNDINSKDFL